MKRLLLYMCVLAVLVLTNISCHDSSGNVAPPDDCSGDIQTAQLNTTISYTAAYTLKSPKAAGDCTTLYRLYFRWADPAKRADGKPPMVMTLDPPPPSGYDVIPQEASDGWWGVSFAPTPTSNTGNTTVFSITAIQSPVGLPDDSVQIQGSIRYLIAPN